MKTKHLFKKLNESFPLSTMGDKFRGSHSITCRDGENLELAIWALNKCFVFGITDGDLQVLETEEGCDRVINEIQQFLTQTEQSK